MKAKTFYWFLLLTFLSVSCGNENKKIKTELYFGLSNAEGAISRKEWDQFQAESIDKVIDGYTIINAEGYWTSSDTTFREPSVLLIYIHEDTADESKRIDSLINIYKLKFRQESVLRTDYEVKALF